MMFTKGLLILSAFLTTAYADCPNVKDSDISPCVCLTNQIRCEGKEVTDKVLQTVLAKIDKSRPDYLKNFEGLELYNTGVTKITTEIFGKLILRTFIKLNNNPIESLSLGNFPDLVFLDASDNKLTNVTSNTFLGLKSLRFANLGGNSIEEFPKNSFSLSDNLQRLVLTGNKIKSLNSDQFSSEYNNNIELSEIDFSFNDLTSLPHNILWPLRRPQIINLSHNKLRDLEADSLSFGEDVWAYEPIRLILASNGLKDGDLSGVTFAHISKQRLAIGLDLSDNGFTHLNETVFQSLLSSNSKTSITLDNNPIKCGDCSHKWIITNKKVNPKQIKLNKCLDDSKRTLSQFTETDFKNCH